MDRVNILNKALWMVYHFNIITILCLLISAGAGLGAPLWFLLVGILLVILSVLLIWENYTLIKRALLETPGCKPSRSEPED